MSLSHLALRLAVIEALAPAAQYAAAVPVWPTLARGRVLDSQIEAEPATEAEARTPLIAVYTDDSKREGYGSAPDAVFDGDENVTLALEILVPVLVEVEPGVQQLLPAAATDARAEAWLNLMVQQVSETLDRARMDGVLRHVLIAVSKVESRPWTDAQTSLRLSARRIEIECMVRAATALQPGLTGLDRLPWPLSEVAKELPANAYGRAIANDLAALLSPAPADFPALDDIRLAVNLTRSDGSTEPPAADAAATPPVGDTALKNIP
ncbi:MAG: hypothetical protein ACK5PJ_07385 [Ralstonia sp.]